MKKTILFLCALMVTLGAISQQKRVLVFSKTAGYRHASIKEGKVFFQAKGKKNNVAIDTTEDASKFTEDNLKRYAAVVFLSTTGNVLNDQQQADFERYIQAGGGYMGIHAATDTEYDWPWYNGLSGAYFASHPGKNVSNVQNATMVVINKTHPSTKHLPENFDHKDEFYDFKSLKTGRLNFLTKVDEKTYKEGQMGDFHPMAWFQDYDGGKAFYSNYGHTPETFSEPLLQKHFWEGLKSVMAEKLDYSKAHSMRIPEENRFVRTTLMSNLDEPTEIAALPDGKIILVERKGLVKMYDPATNKNKTVAKFDKLYTKFEYGLMGVGIDPNFDKNSYLYFYYTPDDEEFNNRLSRFVYDRQRDTILLDTEKTMLKVAVKKVECCHTGGSIDWDAKGNLFLSTGDDTNPFASDGFAPIDFRADRRGWDALSTSGNTNDLRGKILRIHPETDGTYSIPAGNLFEASEKTRPEIYVMGCRNPYRISVDKKTGNLYWGDIGPDAGKADSLRGPAGQVEFNMATKAGFYGWPIFVGDNMAYRQYDFETKKSGPYYDPMAPINDSPNNTGLKNLPPTRLPIVHYSYADSERYPWVGKGGCNPMAGPVYNFDEYRDAPGKFPKYFDGKFFAFEWMRDWIYALRTGPEGGFISAERFMPNSVFAHPMDMTFNRDGVLYVLDYGLNWFAQNEEATLSKVEYNAGNRKPVVAAAADTKVGAAPLTVNFNTNGTLDYDGDALKYTWTFEKGKTSTQANPKYTFKKPGLYEVKLTVTDTKGNRNEKTINLKVGNAEPSIAIKTTGNQTFFFDDEPLAYEVDVKDKEDGSLSTGIEVEDVMVNVDYLEGFDKTILAQGHQTNLGFATGKRLIELSDCKSCHQVEEKSIGPSYRDVSKKYRRNTPNVTMLAEKIIKGGGGVWGEQAMAAHPQVTQTEAKSMVEYILSLNDPKKASKPTKGSVDLKDHKGKKEGAYIISASYTDKGTDAIGPLSASQSLALRSAKVKAVTYDNAKAFSKFKVESVGDVAVATEHNAFISFNDIDMTDIKSITIGAFSLAAQTAGGSLELRQGSPTGTLLGQFDVKENSMAPQKVSLASPIAGKQSIYLVCKNPTSDGKPLFGITDLTFSKNVN